MRSTKAASAVERLKERTGNDGYALVRNADETFQLLDRSGKTPETVGERLPLDEFVAFVKTLGPQVVRRQTKSDIAFEKQLIKKK
ncbi:MAG: hypothetical protein REI95_09145 [Oxalicibacterium faecigallinarum]|uniref:Uncharacterized protein n=1 Tax=Oxalicibacterium faecigallinarum TaxID=573741 RepID=A0A8J3ANA0_9BURK|nr:hypothetical protein [Oxalicibacterium faecigallinarum]MDQ7969794.1 hypothetical protein [Oxalicibacterium faecigallinarum]GGI15834.1 hypothetical protein GCM10008066_00880 [Oxalicibacterium faecigallinarum]